MKKIYLMKNFIEIIESEKNIFGEGGYQKAKDLMQKEKNYIHQCIERRNNVRRLVCNNFTPNDKFVTLTFSNNETDVKKCDLMFKNFIKRLKYKYKLKDFKYVAVIEFQKRGAVHYHMICNASYIPQRDIQNLWQHGFVWLNCIKNVDNLGAYIVKYMTKETADQRLQGLNGYLCSRNLERPFEISNMENKNRDLFLTYNKVVSEKIKNHAPTYEREFNSNVLGKITYTHYNFNKN